MNLTSTFSIYFKKLTSEKTTGSDGYKTSLIVAAVVILIIAYLICRYCGPHRILLRRLVNLGKRALAQAPVKVLLTEDKLIKEADRCIICIQDFKVDEIVLILPCSHSFHKSCIEPWVLQKRTCPLCKTEVLKELGLKITAAEETLWRLIAERDTSVIQYHSPAPETHESPEP